MLRGLHNHKFMNDNADSKIEKAFKVLTDDMKSLEAETDELLETDMEGNKNV